MISRSSALLLLVLFQILMNAEKTPMTAQTILPVLTLEGVMNASAVTATVMTELGIALVKIIIEQYSATFFTQSDPSPLTNRPH